MISSQTTTKVQDSNDINIRLGSIKRMRQKLKGKFKIIYWFEIKKKFKNKSWSKKKKKYGTQLIYLSTQ